jgi:Domain of unknown function (DUF6265)
MKTAVQFLLASSLLLGFTAAAAEPSPDTSKIASVAWLAGRWRSPDEERIAAEEHWSAPAGGAMVGMFRLVNDGRPGIYELLLLEEQSDGVWMRLRHFRPKMVAREQEPIQLKLASAAADKLVFENPSGNQPKRITYALAGNELTATVETERDGKPAAFALKMQRAK